MTPGYWFVAPYNTNNVWESHQGPLYETCQVGPAIYDSNGVSLQRKFQPLGTPRAHESFS